MMNILLLFSCISTAVVGVQVIGDRRETVHITCPYESGYETNDKYLCKGECILGYRNIIVESGSPAKDKRFSLIDDTTERVFTVTITDLRTHDEGKYWCGVSSRFKDVYSEIMLFVKLDNRSTVQPTEHPVAITPSYFSTSVFNLHSTGIKPTDQSLSPTAMPDNFPVTSAVYVSVGLTLIVIGLLVALTVLHKKNRWKKSPKVAHSGPSDQVSAMNFIPESTPEDFYHYDHEYQEIRELQTKNVNSTFTMYSTVQGPADSTIYSTAETPVDSTIYSSAETPVDSTIYSSAETPVDSTIYSSAETPVDSTIYSSAETPVDSTIYSTAETPVDSTIYSSADTPSDSTIYSSAVL